MAERVAIAREEETYGSERRRMRRPHSVPCLSLLARLDQQVGKGKARHVANWPSTAAHESRGVIYTTGHWGVSEISDRVVRVLNNSDIQ